MTSYKDRLVFPLAATAERGTFTVDLSSIANSQPVYLLGDWLLNLEFLAFNSALSDQDFLEVISPEIRSSTANKDKGIYPSLSNISVAYIQGDGKTKNFIFKANQNCVQFTTPISIKTESLTLEVRQPLKDNKPLFEKKVFVKGHIWIPL